MSTFHLRKLAAFSAALLLSSGSLLLTGCGPGAVSGGSSAVAPVTLSGAHIYGRVHGGVYPIQGSNIELWQSTVGTWNTNTTSYTPSFYGTSTNSGYIAATTSAVQGDGSGRAPGYFDFGTQTLTCTAGNYVYLTTTGGGTIASKANSSVIQVALIGQCPASNQQTAYFNNVNVFLSETSTVAAAYALGNFLSVDTDPNTNLQRVNVAAPSNNTATGACSASNGPLTCTGAGLAHAFADANNLVDYVRFDGSNPTGAARLSLPKNSQASAPQAMINTISNILQSCVDSGPSTTSSPSSTCNTLFGDVPTNSAGSTPTDTLQATLNLSRSPSTNAKTLFGLQTANSPFTPMMSSAPTAFSLAIFYPAAAIGDANLTAPVDVALDAADNVYLAYMQGTANGAVAELSAAGTPIFHGAVPANTASLTNPGTIAVDPSGYVWVTDDSAVSAQSSAGNAFGFNTSLTSTGSVIGTYYKTYTMPNGKASGIAFDGSGNAFLTRDSTDKNINDYFFSSGNYVYTQKGTVTGANLKRAQVDAYGTFKAVGNKTFAAFAPLPCNQNTYADDSVTLDTTGGLALAVDNRSNNYNTFMPMTKKLVTANVTASGNKRCFTAITAVNDYAGSATNDANANTAALDGSGNLFFTGNGGRLWSYLGAEGYETSTNGTLGGTPTNFLPCYLGTATSCSYTSSLNGLAIDSSGALWYGATDSSGNGYLVQHFGLAQPTWPLLAYAQSGVAF